MMDALDCHVGRNKNYFVQEVGIVNVDIFNLPLLMLFVLVMTNVEEIGEPRLTLQKGKHGHHDFHHDFEFTTVFSCVHHSRCTLFFLT